MATEAAFWANSLSQGVTRAQVALTVETSANGATQLVASFFQAYLHRMPSASELAFFQTLLGSGASDGQVQVGVLGSPEYSLTQGGGSPAGFLNALYCDVLHHPVNPTVEAADLHALDSNVSRQQVAQTVLSSPEYLQGLVQGWYEQYLRRSADPGGLNAYVNLLQHGGTDEQAVASTVSIDEYFNHFASGATFVNPVISGHGLIQLTLHHAATLNLVVLRVIHPGTASPRLPHLATVLNPPTLHPPKVRHVGVVALGHHHAGHVTIRWNRKVGGRTLPRGHYLLVLQAHVGHKLTDVSDAIAFTQR